jgi:uncharacterized membrane protein
VLGGLLPGTQHLQNIHPLIVHFPIAFLYGAALLYFLAWVMQREPWAWTALWMLGLGTLGALAAAATGLYGGEGVMLAMSVKTALLTPHKRLMLVACVLGLVLTEWALLADRPFPHSGRPAFLLLMLVLVGILTWGADYGGRMVYDYNAGGNACGQPIEFSQ